ncbi:paraneoplastic antigen Ma6E-like [Engraulis encrasicolus]|uniref:paraneoplastic antigen Ma6E-like n=1 Tax=Engraulis encrasicolus TaxID=184585 RepID=UPI002FD78F00
MTPLLIFRMLCACLLLGEVFGYYGYYGNWGFPYGYYGYPGYAHAQAARQAAPVSQTQSPAQKPQAAAKGPGQVSQADVSQTGPAATHDAGGDLGSFPASGGAGDAASMDGAGAAAFMDGAGEAAFMDGAAGAAFMDGAGAAFMDGAGEDAFMDGAGEDAFMDGAGADADRLLVLTAPSGFQSRYVVRSFNRYQRGKRVFSQTTYIPLDFPPPPPASGEGPAMVSKPEEDSPAMAFMPAKKG